MLDIGEIPNNFAKKTRRGLNFTAGRIYRLINSGLSTKVDNVEYRILASAFKHGFNEDEILHAVRNAILAWPMDGYTMLVGSSGVGMLLEVAVRDGVIFYAMECRKKFMGKGDSR